MMGRVDLAQCLDFLEKHRDAENHDTHNTAEDVRMYKAAPLFTGESYMTAVQQNDSFAPGEETYPQCGLLGTLSDTSEEAFAPLETKEGNIVLSNTSEPWSAFICGSQGSGKSHTMACLLENSLLSPSPIGVLDTPITGMVFHYDKFSNLGRGQVCEAAYLCSSNIPIRVLVAPTSLNRMMNQYRNLPGLPAGSAVPKVLPLYFSQNQLSAEVMMTLMAVQETGVAAPLYISAISQLLRDMAMDNQENSKVDDGFDYNDFQYRLSQLGLERGQIAPLKLRLDLLRSVLLDKVQTPDALAEHKETWEPEAGSLTIVDLSDQFVNEADACALFSICLKLFMGNWQSNPRIIALDEAHKFLTSSDEARKLITDLVSIIRQQRHLGSRVVLATQEPTVSGDLLDLCNVSIVHRFTSPQWYSKIRQHLAGAHVDGRNDDGIFREIVKLSTGEALVFCPTAVLGRDHDSGKPRPLQDAYFKLSVRPRISIDGGQSVLPSSRFHSQETHDQIGYIVPKFKRLMTDNFLDSKAGISKARPKNVTGTQVPSVAPADAVINHAQPSANSQADGKGKATLSTQARGPTKNKPIVTQTPAIVQNAVAGVKNKAITWEVLKQHMYANVEDTLGKSPPKDPSGYLHTWLGKTSVNLGLPKDFLLKQYLLEGCPEVDAKKMLKRVIKEYYDDKGIAKVKRADYKWLRS